MPLFEYGPYSINCDPNRTRTDFFPQLFQKILTRAHPMLSVVESPYQSTLHKVFVGQCRETLSMGEKLVICLCLVSMHEVCGCAS